MSLPPLGAMLGSALSSCTLAYSRLVFIVIIIIFVVNIIKVIIGVIIIIMIVVNMIIVVIIDIFLIISVLIIVVIVMKNSFPISIINKIIIIIILCQTCLYLPFGTSIPRSIRLGEFQSFPSPILVLSLSTLLLFDDDGEGPKIGTPNVITSFGQFSGS